MELTDEAKRVISLEERLLTEVLDSLAEQLSTLSQRFRRESARSRELTSELVAATRDEDKAMLASDEAVSHELSKRQASDVKRLHKLIRKPYFARFVLAEEQEGAIREFEYKLGFAANPDCRIVDWRKAPVSKLFYEYHEGDEYSEEIQGHERTGVVKLRNSVEIERSRLLRISCREGQFLWENGNWQQVSGPAAAKARSGTASSYAQLPNILSLITPEQFKLITEPAETALLIQGIAGSGKTTVALHRLAWLLHEDNSPYKPADCVIIVLSKILKAYISTTLPSMGVPEVRILTLQEWFAESLGQALPHFLNDQGHIKRPAERCSAGIERLKRSMALLQVLEHGEAKHFQSLIARLNQALPWERLPGGVRKAFDTAAQGPARSGRLLQAIADSLRRGLEVIKPDNSYYSALVEAHRITVDSFSRQTDLQQRLIEALSNPQQIIAEDETGLITKELVENARIRTMRNFDEGVLDACDDGLLLRLIQVSEGGTYRSDGSLGHYEHIVVDEVQDLSPVDLAGVVAAVPDPSRLTLVGDVAQKIEENSTFPGWDKLMRRWEFKDSIAKYVSLTVSHRSTLPIMRLGDHIQGQRTVSKGRPGRVPIWFKCYSEHRGIRCSIEWIAKAQQRFPGSLTAVLCRDPAEAKHVVSLLEPTFGAVVRLGDEYSFSFSEGIVVTSVAQVKGLEFQNVLIWNPSSQRYPKESQTRNLLYVAITRAEENLCITTWSRPSPYLPSISSHLVRGINYREDEQ